VEGDNTENRTLLPSLFFNGKKLDMLFPIQKRSFVVIYPGNVLRLFISCVLVITISGLAGCSVPQTTTPASLQSKALKVGVSANAPPFAFKKNNRLQGMEIELAQQLGSFLDRPVQFVESPWKALLPSLEKGRIDIVMSGMTITEKRNYRVAFSKPYMRSGQMLLVRSTEAGRYAEGIYSLMGNNPLIGTIENTTGDYFITKTINRAHIEHFSTTRKAVQALIEGKIDVFVHDAPIISYMATVAEGQKLVATPQIASEEYLGWAVRKDNPQLLQAVNSFLDNNSENQLMKTTIKKWVPYL